MPSIHAQQPKRGLEVTRSCKKKKSELLSIQAYLPSSLIPPSPSLFLFHLLFTFLFFFCFSRLFSNEPPTCCGQFRILFFSHLLFISTPQYWETEHPISLLLIAFPNHLAFYAAFKQQKKAKFCFYFLSPYLIIIIIIVFFLGTV